MNCPDCGDLKEEIKRLKEGLDHFVLVAKIRLERIDEVWDERERQVDRAEQAEHLHGECLRLLSDAEARLAEAEKERDLARQDAERHLNNWRIATRNAANTRAQEYRADLLQIGAELDRLSVSQCATEGECRCGLCEAKRIAREALEDK